MAERLSQYERGFRDGMAIGLKQCGPVSGITKFFKRKKLLGKLDEMKASERQRVIQDALDEYTAETEGVAEKFAANPKRTKKKAKRTSKTSVSALVRRATK